MNWERQTKTLAIQALCVGDPDQAFHPRQLVLDETHLPHRCPGSDCHSGPGSLTVPNLKTEGCYV